MSFKTIGVYALALALVSTLALSARPATAAIDWEQRRIEREAERAARDAEREARRAAREAEKAAEEEAKEAEKTACKCSASLGFAKPEVQFRNGVLSLVPRVDISIRSRGEDNAPKWNAVLNYEGTASYSSEDVAAPAGNSFGGSQEVVGGSCGTNYTLKGRALPTVTLAGVLQSLVGVDQELKGTVKMRASLTGCGDTEEEHRQFEVRILEFGNLKVGSWRAPR